MSAIPVIDVAPLMTGSTEQAKAVAAALGRACREVGFFYIVGHGIPPELRAKVFTTSAAFFAGPASVRQVVRRAWSASFVARRRVFNSTARARSSGVM